MRIQRVIYNNLVALLVLALVFMFMPAPSRATSTLTQCRFSSFQVFDVQWYISGGNLYVSGVTSPYDSNFSQPTTQSGDYYQFFDSATNSGTYGLKLFNSDGSLQQVMHNTGNFSAIGTDFLFYQGSGFFGTVFTTTQGLAYGSSAVLPVTQQNPTNQQVASTVNCSSTPIEQVGPAPTTTTIPESTPTTTTPPIGQPDTAVCASSYEASNFVLGGSSTDSSGTVTLTQPMGNQFGSLWSRSRVDIASDFCIHAEVFLGNSDGADGLAFIMQPNSVAAGSTGGGLGYAGISPSFAVEYDTWANSGDLPNDHVGLMKNGLTTSHSEWGVGASDVGNIEDGQWRKTKIFWDAFQDSITVFFDKNADGDMDDSGEILFEDVSVDLGGLFAGSSGFTYWGFTAATGGSVNLQQVRNITYNAVSRTNSAPSIASAPANTQASAGEQTVIPFTLSDDSTSAGQWVVRATSSDTTVLPQSAITVSMTNPTEGSIIVAPSLSASGGTSQITLSATDADGQTVTSAFTVTLTAYVGNSLRVTSLADTTAAGTLRWAITQANSQNGGIYDSITFASGLSGTITLNSMLPSIVGSLTITGNGQENTIIDGQGSYRIFWIGTSNSLTISNITLRRGANANGGMIFNTRGTVSATNVRFTTMSGGTAVFNDNGTSVATYTNCIWDGLSVGIAGDYGSTPQLPAGTTTWQNYADTGFQNRTYVTNNTFTGNGMAIRNYRFTKIVNSTFTNNNYAAYVTGLNRTQILSSTFTSNGIAVYHNSWIPNTFNMGTDNRLIEGNTFTANGTAIYLDDTYSNGQKYQGWSTVRNNTWDGEGNWVVYYLWDGSANAYGSVAPDQETTVFNQSANTPTPTTTTTTTTTTVPAPAETSNQTPAPDQGASTPEVPVETTTPPQTTIAPPAEDAEPSEPQDDPSETTPSLPRAESSDTAEEEPQQEPEAQNPSINQETYASEITLPDDATSQILDSLDNSVSAEDLAGSVAEILSDLDPAEVVSVLDSIIDAVVADTPVDELTEEDKEKLVAVVVAVIEAGLSGDVANQLASSPAVLASVEPSQAEAVFEQVDAGSLTAEVAEQIVDAVQEAPNEIREVFEDVVDLFQGAFDDYKMLGQTISVGQRRTVVAVTALTTAIGGAMAAGGSFGGSPLGGTSPSSPSSPNDAARREEEEEASGEIAGDGVEWIKKIRIFKYVDGVRVVDWKAFSKKFGYGVMNLGFTLAGSLVVYLTLSGPIQIIAGLSTVAAFGAAMWLHMKEPEGE